MGSQGPLGAMSPPAVGQQESGDPQLCTTKSRFIQHSELWKGMWPVRQLTAAGQLPGHSQLGHALTLLLQTGRWSGSPALWAAVRAAQRSQSW